MTATGSERTDQSNPSPLSPATRRMLGESWELLGFALGDEGNVDAARMAFEQAAQIDPEHDKTVENLAYFAMQCGRYDQAITSLQTVVERSPDRASAWATLGVALDLGGRPDEAAAVFAEALRRHPDDRQIRTNVAAFERRRDSS